MKVITYSNGTPSSVTLKDDDNKKVRQLITQLLLKTDDMLRVYFDEERINDIKLKEKCIELLFEKSEMFETGISGEMNINKILIPFSGDFQATEQIDVVTILIGEDEYSSGPLTASGGYHLLQELKIIVFPEK